MVYNYEDDYGNKATIDYCRRPAYKGDKFPDGTDRLSEHYRLTCTAYYPTYMNPYVYHVSVYETFEEAETELKKLSCGTFKEVK